MPQFRKLDPQDVTIGRGASTAMLIAEIAVAIYDAHAGAIDLVDDEKPGPFHRYLHLAAKRNDMKVRCTFDAETNSIVWKAVGA